MKQSKVLFLITSILLLTSTINSSAFARKWNNPENERRYHDALRQESESRRRESDAWQNYDRKLKGGEDTTRCVRNSAFRGNVKPIGCARHIR